MEVITTIEALRARLAARPDGATVGLVPTMGYLHDGHVSLLDRARLDTDLVIMSIFVNPLQFGEGEDLAAYPRDLTGDTARAEAAGVDVVFVPDVAEMYPEHPLTSVVVASLGSSMEGESRPTHFTGVATVVAKLFTIVGPCRAYFGEKDYQQLAIVVRMAADLSMPVEVIGCPVVREQDGLAMSSRNVYLTPGERAAAPVLYRALRAAAGAVSAGERDGGEVRRIIARMVDAEPLAALDYAEVVEARSLAPTSVIRGEIRLLAAARFGRARLLDNLGVLVPEQG